MNNENLKNVLIIDRETNKVLNEPEIELDEEVYAEAVERLVAELLLSIKRGVDLKNSTPKDVFSWKKTEQQKV